MGIDHPLLPELESPPSPFPRESQAEQLGSPEWLVHHVEMTDTLAGIAIKYGIEISDVKRMNNLLSDHQMFALKSLLIPLPGKTPTPVKPNGYARNAFRKCSSERRPAKDGFKSYNLIFKTSESPHQVASPAMNSLQRYYGLGADKGGLLEEGTEMAAYSIDKLQRRVTEPFPRDLTHPIDPPIHSIGSENGFQRQCDELWEGNSSASKIGMSEVSVRRRQKAEVDSLISINEMLEDTSSSSGKTGRAPLPRPSSGHRLNMDYGRQDSSANRDNPTNNGYSSVRKSLSMSSFADSDNGVSLWPSSKWGLSTEALARPLLDGLPVSVPVWRSKAALD